MEKGKNFRLNGALQLKTLIPVVIVLIGIIFSYASFTTKVEVLEEKQQTLEKVQRECVKREEAPSRSDVEVLKTKICNIEEDVIEIKTDLKGVQRDIKELLRNHPGQKNKKGLIDKPGG